MTLEEITEKLKQNLKENRFLHSLSVAETAKELALSNGIDENKAYLAGLIHDLAKGYSDEELLNKALKYNIAPKGELKKLLPILHSFVGAYEIKNLFGIEDKEIFDAVFYHTTGKEAMVPLTAIVYLADAIEPLRNYPDAERLRLLAKESLNDAIYEYASMCIDYVEKKGQYLHPDTLKVKKYYSKR